MVTYAESELFSVTEFSKQLSSLVKKIKNNSMKKIGILKNNRLEVVVISTEEYSRLKELESQIQSAELEDIYKSIKDRKKTPKSEYISLDEMAEKFDIDVKSL
jgi:PHD/YefM family antitoxin component YafN of YafNO toxin-antitoxin module